MGAEFFVEKDLFEVFIKMNYDDFVADYWYSINDDQVFESNGKIDTTIVLVSKYLNDKVQIFADDKKLKGQLKNIESANGELKMNVEYKLNKRAKRFKVKNHILADVYNDQSNLLIYRYKDFEEGIKLTPEKREHIFKVK
jgi:hypothetical protein